MTTRSALVGRLADRLGGAPYAAGWSLVQALPEPVAVRLFDAAADLAVRRGGARIDQLTANLRRVEPYTDGHLRIGGRRGAPDLVGAAMRSYARYWREVFRLPLTGRQRIVEGMVTVGEHRLRESVASADGTILALPHTGNWDHAGAWCAATGAPFTTVAERLRPASVFDRFVAFRESLGMEVLPLTGGSRPVGAVLRSRLEAGGMLCLLADRDLSATGVEVDFFGSRARMPAGPAALAVRTGATLLPVTLSFTPTGWRAVFHEPVPAGDPRTMTQQLADAFARGIAEHPADWHMLQPLWPDDLPARRAPG